MSEKEIGAYVTAILGVLYGLAQWWWSQRRAKRVAVQADAKAVLEQKSDEADAERGHREKDFVTSRLERFADRLQKDVFELRKELAAAYRQLADLQVRFEAAEKENKLMRWKIVLQEGLDENSAGGGKAAPDSDDLPVA